MFIFLVLAFSSGVYNTFRGSSDSSSIFLFASLKPEGSGRTSQFIDSYHEILEFSSDAEMTHAFKDVNIISFDSLLER